METVRLRTRLAGYSMLAGGLLMTVPPFLGPPNGADDTRQRLHDLAANPGPTIAKSLVFQLAVLLLLPGVAAIVGRTVGRGSALVVSGGVAYGAGIVGVSGFLLMTGVEASLAQSGPIDGELVAAADKIGMAPAAIPAFVLGLLVFHLLALPWLTAGMARARQIGWSVVLAATAGTGLAFFGSGTRLETVGWVVLGLTIACLGYRVVRPRGTVAKVPSLEPALIG
jgi:hypothetical protein